MYSEFIIKSKKTDLYFYRKWVGEVMSIFDTKSNKKQVIIIQIHL
jgi:hypothetical protein